MDPLAEDFPGWNPYHYVHNNPINLIDPTGMSADGWGEKDGAWEYKDEITKDNYKDLGYSDYMSSGNIIGSNNSYDYSLNSDGTVGHDGLTSFAETTTPAGTKIIPRAFSSDYFSSRRASGAITPMGGAFDIFGFGEVIGGMITDGFSELTGNVEVGAILALVATKGKAQVSLGSTKGQEKGSLSETKKALAEVKRMLGGLSLPKGK